MQKITPCLWFDHEALDAANYYISIFPNSEIKNILHYDDSNPFGTPGEVMMVDFVIDKSHFIALNGGTVFQITPAISFVIPCENQIEIDRYWDWLSYVPEAEQCGWVQDKFGVSWQIVPKILDKLMADSDKEKAGRVTRAFLDMKKVDIAKLEKAYKGE